MSEISDEMLMAYADGALDPDERIRVEAMIAERPDLQSRLAVFAATGKALGVPFGAIARQDPPQRLVDAVMGSGTTEPIGARAQAPTRGLRESAWQRLKQLVPLDAFALPLAHTAALLLVGGGIGWYAARATLPDGPYVIEGSQLLARGALADALETSPSGRRPQSAGAPQIRLTFKSAGTYCRQYQMAAAAGDGLAGMACRRGDNRWQVTAHTSASVVPTGDGTKPAGGSDTSLIDSALDRLMEGDALGAEEEEALISRHWHH